MEAIAKYNNIKLSPRKTRKVVDLIRTMNVMQAIKVLRHLPQKAAPYVKDVLMSAVANLNQKHQGKLLLNSAIVIKEIYVNIGKVLKRIKPAPRGRAHPIRKPSTHIFVKVYLDETQQSKTPSVQQRGAKLLSDSKKATAKPKNLSAAPSKASGTPEKADKQAKAKVAPTKATAPKKEESTASQGAAEKQAADAPKAKAAPIKATSPKKEESTTPKKATHNQTGDAPETKAATAKPMPSEAKKSVQQAEESKQQNTLKEGQENTKPLQKK